MGKDHIDERFIDEMIPVIWDAFTISFGLMLLLTKIECTTTETAEFILDISAPYITIRKNVHNDYEKCYGVFLFFVYGVCANFKLFFHLK